MTMGRPKIQITKELCNKAEQFASQGLTMEQIADALGMSKSSLFEKQKENLDLMEAIKRGKAQGIVTIFFSNNSSMARFIVCSSQLQSSAILLFEG